ncbi:pheromone shutdown-related protein TraB [Methanocella conradii HZ254]|uniref:Pheromone shutdown-related protein TraB n=1 Tax=Methanocella conradii (strain DSM 24694 / JCM 17849 / CGMCC 1.5162 / HZ254) TaxID=1041930 RepID=H8I5M8_METCZ|nr:TraB/GumN family protein [Methanocella conradii]AFC99347.1 pheromone shutdown-related protein TraB [Methanocella conradii HZ254]MDI6896872.1 TraB/GumN family protein [Methanocella conradii]
MLIEGQASNEQRISPNPKDNIVLVGTAHVSEKSIRDVEEAIEAYRPDIVAVELDARRYQALKEGGQEKKEIPIKELLKGNNLAIFLIQTMLAFVQRKVGAEMGVKPGSEMLAAIEAANKRGIPVALIDRDLGVTLARFWSKMSLREKFRMLYSLILAALGIGTKDIDVDKMTSEDVVADLIEELREFTPSVAEVLVDERDAYLAHNLLELGKTKKVVAVVGAGHREGIKRHLEHPESMPPMESISSVPKRRRIPWLKLFSGLVVLSVVFVFMLLILSGIPLEQLLLALLVLFIVQGALSALFVALVGGHWKSVATAFALAWYAFLNPVLAIGWLAGVVEAAQRPPTMEDLNGLLGSDDSGVIDTLKGMLDNRLFKAIAVAAMANIGSMVGTFVGAAILVYYFHLTDPVQLLQSGVSNGYHAVASWLAALRL